MQRSDLLNEAERKLWDAFPRGTVVDLGDGDPTAEDFDPDTWPEDRQVRGEVIARLLLGVQDREAGYVARVALRGARIAGELNIGGGQTEYELVLIRCWVNAPPDFTGASSGPTTFYRTRLPGFTGRDWQARGSVSFGQSKCPKRHPPSVRRHDRLDANEYQAYISAIERQLKRLSDSSAE